MLALGEEVRDCPLWFGTAIDSGHARGAGNDTLTGGADDYRIDGGSGIDTAVFVGLWRQSALMRDGAGERDRHWPRRNGHADERRAVRIQRRPFRLQRRECVAQIMRRTMPCRATTNDIEFDLYLDMSDDRGGTMAGVAGNLIGSGEFLGAAGEFENVSFVDYLYRNNLGRAPDSGGRAFILY